MMAGNYKLATGHDNEAGFATLSFPVYSPAGIQYPEYRPDADGGMTGHGNAFIECRADVLQISEYNELFTASGMSTSIGVSSALVTAALPALDRSGAFANYNGTMIHRKGVDATFNPAGYWEDVRWTIIKLVST